MRKLTAFVAHSFAPQDQPRIQPIREHLDSFRDLGFVWRSAEQAEAERVSDKVQRMILESDVFVGILTRKFPVYDIAGGFRDAWRILTASLQPTVWTAPAWILQEIGFAVALKKKVILFVEPNLDFPFLQGDLEYIPYNHSNAAQAFKTASEMINKLIARHAGITVEIVVREESEQKEKPTEATPAPEHKPESEQPRPAEPGFGSVFIEFEDAIEKRNLDLARERLQAGLDIIRTQPTSLRELTWQCYCHSRLYEAGEVSALEQLKHFERTNPDDPTPPQYIGHSLLSFKEWAEAAKYFKRTAELSKEEDHKASCLLDAASALVEAKMLDEAEQILMGLLCRTQGDIRTRAAQQLYTILKTSSKHIEAFGVAEATLHENPALASFRFDVGLDYHTQDQSELFMYHFDLLRDREASRPDITHDLALAFSECNLPITSVAHYKRAIELGGARAARNLGYKYVDAGMVDEANHILNEAIKNPDAGPEVGRCLADIPEKQEKEAERYKSLLKAADKQRLFLAALGEGLFQESVQAPDGRWQMPFGKSTFASKKAH